MSDPLNAFLRLGKLQWYGGFNLGCYTPGRFDCDVDRFIGYHEMRYIVQGDSALDPFATDAFSHRLGARYAHTWAQHGAEIPVPEWRRGEHLTGETSRGRYYSLHGYGEVYGSLFGWMHEIQDVQAAVLLRGQSAEVLAAFEPRKAATMGSLCALGSSHWCAPVGPWKAAFATATFKVGLVVSTRPGVFARAIGEQAPRSGVARLKVPLDGDSAIVSVEARTTDVIGTLFGARSAVASRRRLAVFRPGIHDTTRVKSSDLLVFDASGGALPASADSALAMMLPRSTLSRDEHAGVYWELYGLQPGDTPEFELAVESLRPAGVVKSLMRNLGLSRGSGTVLARWTAAPVTAADIGRFGESSFAVGVLLANLWPGENELSVSTRLAGEVIVRVEKRLLIR
jgi:hypothetical protein